MNELERKLATENEYAYRCCCPCCGEMHAYHHGRKPVRNGDPLMSENITYPDGSRPSNGDEPEHARKCSSGEVSGYGNPLFRVDKMERIEL